MHDKPARLSHREQACANCGDSYQARRSSSRYCSSRCRQAAGRATEDETKEQPHIIARTLASYGMVGQVSGGYAYGRTEKRDGLTVPLATALAEYNANHPHMRLSEAELRTALKRAGVLVYDEPPPLHKKSRRKAAA